MKSIIGLWLLFLSLNTNAEIYKVLVTGWNYKSGYDYMLHLESPLTKFHLVLDCQSFIHELVLYENEVEDSDRLFEMYLNPNSCYQLGSWVISHTDMGGKMCFIIDSEQRTIDINTTNYQFCF